MSTIRRKQFKILNTVVRFITIDMVDLLFFFKKSSNVRFHYKAMFKNISLTVTKWVVMFTDKYIPTAGCISPAFPIWIFRSCKVRFPPIPRFKVFLESCFFATNAFVTFNESSVFVSHKFIIQSYCTQVNRMVK